MYRYSKILISVYSCLLIFGCTEVSIYADHDNQIDFTNYKTFSVCADDIEVVNKNHPVYDNVFNRKRIKKMIIDEMTQLGYELDEVNSELKIGFQIIISNHQFMASDCGGYNLYEYWNQCKITTYNYTEGTLVIHASDVKKNQVIWQGTANSVLDIPPKKIKKVINKTVKQIFEKYPIKNSEKK